MKKIVILGAGFGGVRAVLDLEKKLGDKAEITLIDRNNFHLFTPALYEVATANGVVDDEYNTALRATISIPLPDIFNGKNINVVQANVDRVDLNNKVVETSGENKFEYDYLVVGIGAETSFFNIPGAGEYAYNLKNINDAININKHIDNVFDRLKKEDKKEEPAKFVVIGGGFTGIEVSAELGCCLNRKAESCNMDSKLCTSVTLIEAGPMILKNIGENDRKAIRKRLKELSINIIEGTSVTEVRDDHVLTKDGKTIKADIIIWSGGITGASLLKKIGDGKLEFNQKGMVKVNKYTQANGYTDVFVIGDSSEIMDEKKEVPVPALAYIAVDQGAIAAQNIAALINDRPLKPYNPFYSVWVAPVGAKWAAAHIAENITVKGFLGWVMRLIIDFKYFLTIMSPLKAIKLLTKTVVIFSKND